MKVPSADRTTRRVGVFAAAAVVTLVATVIADLWRDHLLDEPKQHLLATNCLPHLPVPGSVHALLVGSTVLSALTIGLFVIALVLRVKSGSFGVIGVVLCVVLGFVVLHMLIDVATILNPEEQTLPGYAPCRSRL